MFYDRKTLRLYLADIGIFSLLHAIFAFAAVFITLDTRLVWPSLLAFIPFMLISLCKHNLSSSLIFCLIAISPPVAAGFALPLPVLEKILIIIFLAVCTFYSIYSRVHIKSELGFGFLIFAACICALLLVLNTLYGGKSIAPVLIFHSIVQIICWLVSAQTSYVDSNLKIAAKNPRLPAKSIIKTSNALLAVFIVLLLAVFLFSPLIPLEQTLSLLGAGFSALLGFLFKNASQNSEPEIPEELFAEQLPDEIGMVTAANKPHPIWEIILNILQYVFILIAIIVIGFLIVRAVLHILQSLRAAKPESGKDYREFITPDTAFSSLPKFFKRLQNSRFGKGEQAKIRRQYYKTVKKHIRRGVKVSPADTPLQIEQKITANNENILELTKQYEQVRYSNTPTA